jgi:hypothetical protein
MNPFKDVIYKQGSDGRYFQLHWRLRFGPALMVVGALVGAYGQVQAGQAAAVEGKSSRNMAEYNAALQEREAKQIEARTALQQRRQAEESERKMGTLRVGLGASGAVTTAGSPLMIQAQQASEFELENLMTGYEGREEATAARSGAALSRMEGKMAMQKGKAAKLAGYIGAGSTLLTGFGSAYTPKPPGLTK